MSKIIYCGPYYDSSKEEEIISISKGKLNNASNCFQTALLNGMTEICDQDRMIIINTLPIGIWPIYSTDLVLKEKEWMFKKCAAHEIGGINLPIIKQQDREIRFCKYLQKVVEPGDFILLYSCYLPFMKAISKMKEQIHFSIIVTDLPEFYDLGKTSILKKIARKFNNSIIYRKMKQVDSFVILTEQMREPLMIGNRPYIVIEGIWCDEKIKSKSVIPDVKKKIIFYSGTLHYQFGIQNLLDAFAQIKEEKYELWICGGGEAADRIKKLAEKDNRIKFFGFCSSEKVAKLRRQASVLVNPRPVEGEYTKYSFPSKTMEYLASGIPVVMFHLPGIPVEYDQFINYVGDSSVESLKTRIIDVVDNYSVAHDKALCGQRFILEKKNSYQQATRLIKFLEEHRKG